MDEILKDLLGEQFKITKVSDAINTEDGTKLIVFGLLKGKPIKIRITIQE